jgi:vacuolar-type H+-ATPase subunit E/Vma4
LSLSAELTEALQFVERDGAVVRCSVDLASILREALRAQSEIKVQPVSDLGTGFIVVGREESVLVDARLDARVDSLASVLAIEIHNLLGEP